MKNSQTASRYLSEHQWDTLHYKIQPNNNHITITTCYHSINLFLTAFICLYMNTCQKNLPRWLGMTAKSHPLPSTKTGDQISSSLKFLLIQKTICLMYLLDILKLKNLDLLWSSFPFVFLAKVQLWFNCHSELTKLAAVAHI